MRDPPTPHTPPPPPPPPLRPQVLQHEIRKTHAKSQALEWIEELSLIEIIGKGGFGVVYKGTWKGSVAAVKVREGGGREGRTTAAVGLGGCSRTC